MKILKLIIILPLFVIFLNCSTGSSIITGKVRPAISPSDVKIYLDPPLKYETIGLVEASSDVEFSTQAAQDRVIAELKSQAAKIGANGVLLITAEKKSGEIVGFYSNGIFYASETETRTAQAKAIYVIKD